MAADAVLEEWMALREPRRVLAPMRGQTPAEPLVHHRQPRNERESWVKGSAGLRLGRHPPIRNATANKTPSRTAADLSHDAARRGDLSLVRAGNVPCCPTGS